MANLRRRGEQIRQFILDNVDKSPSNIANIAARHFGISRQAVNKHIRQLVDQKALLASGTTRNKQYSLAPIAEWTKNYDLNGDLEEDQIWRHDIEPNLKGLPDNVLEIWHYGTTEMINNAIDHSEADLLQIHLERTAANIKLIIIDDGTGIFKKIQREMNLSDERHAVLELAKGKLTTDPDNHTGEGIFFTSRMFDDFTIMSGNVYFTHNHKGPEDWILEKESPMTGTAVFLELRNNTSRTSKQVFDNFSSDDDYSFSKTVVPVHLAQYGEEKLVSRSQAKRLLARIDRFRVVIFDFSGVESIGQAFADEVFRVFRNKNPDITIQHLNAGHEVQQMIKRALAQ